MKLLYRRMGKSMVVAQRVPSDIDLESHFGEGIINLGIRGKWSVYLSRRDGIFFIDTDSKINPFRTYERGKLERTFQKLYGYQDLVDYLFRFVVDGDGTILKVIDRKHEKIYFLNVQDVMDFKLGVVDLFGKYNNTLVSRVTISKTLANAKGVLILEKGMQDEFVLSVEKRVLAKYVVDFAMNKYNKLVNN